MYRFLLVAAVVPLTRGDYSYDYTDAPTAAPTDDALSAVGNFNDLDVCPASTLPPRLTLFSSAGQRGRRHTDRDRRLQRPLRLPRVLPLTAPNLVSFRRAEMATTR